MILNVILHVVLTALTFSIVLSSVQFSFEHVEILTSSNLEKFKQSTHVSLVYYYKRELPRIKGFFKELDKSAQYLRNYGSKIGLFDCTVDNDDGCSEKKVEHNLITYIDATELMRLELETMFDVNSIMSNVLQVILLSDVPIVQTLESRHELEMKEKGKKDIIYSYHKAIGTYEHRVFLELAFAYQNRYLFAVTTELESIQGLIDDVKVNHEQSQAAVWILYCKDSQKTGPGCENVMYRGNMDLPSLAKYLKTITTPSVFYYPEDGSVPKCREDGMDCLLLFYDAASKDRVMEAAENVKYIVHGVAGTAAVNVEHRNTDLSQVAFDKRAPAVGILRGGVTYYMDKEWTWENIDTFVHENFFKEIQEESFSKQIFDEELDLPSIEEVETQDDEVADAVFQLARKPLELNVPVLTDKTFPTTIAGSPLTVVLFYLPFDSQSKAFMRSYMEVVEILKEPDSGKSPLTIVNCHDWTDVCQKQNITIYPTTRVFRQTAQPVDYQGPLDTRAVASAVKLLQLDMPIKLESQDDVERFAIGDLPRGAGESYSNVSVLGIFDMASEKELKAFKNVAQALQSSFLFAVATPTHSKCSMCSGKVPSITVFRHNDVITPAVTATEHLTEQGIEAFIQRSRVPTLPELTVDVFPLLYNQEKPFVVLFCNSSDEDKKAEAMIPLAELAEAGTFPGLIFTWIDGSDDVGKTILQEYDAYAVLPSLSFVDIKKGEVYNMPHDEMTVKYVSDWLQDITDRQIEPSKMLKTSEWKPLKRAYDYLKMQEFELRIEKEPTAAEEVTASEDLEKLSVAEDSSVDDEIRAELEELRRSRLYNLQERRAKDRKDHEPSHTHTEL